VSAFGYFSLEHLPDVRPVDVNMIKQLSGHALDGGLSKYNGGK